MTVAGQHGNIHAMAMIRQVPIDHYAADRTRSQADDAPHGAGMLRIVAGMLDRSLPSKQRPRYERRKWRAKREQLSQEIAVSGCLRADIKMVGTVAKGSIEGNCRLHGNTGDQETVQSA